MNVAFIVTSHWSYGELLIAQEFARSIEKYGFKPYFIIPISHEKTMIRSKFPYCLLLPNNGNVNRVLLRDFENKYKPRFVILSDFINYCFCERHYGLTVKDLEIFSGKLGTFDNFDYDLVKRKMDTYGFTAREVSNLDINGYGFKLVPCPIANPKNASEALSGKYYYPLVNDFLEYNDDIKQNLRKELNLPIGKPVVLITSATWQETFKLYPHVKKFVSLANQVFKNILTRISKDALILYVGPKTFFGDLYANDDVVMLGQLQPEIFDRYACTADLFLSRNITSTTLAKITMSGIPSLMISSSLNIRTKEVCRDDYLSGFKLKEDVKKVINDLDICYSYRMFPVGWYSFLEPVLKDNSYTKIVPEVELFNEDECVEKIKSLLEDNKLKESMGVSLDKYRVSINALMKPYEILSMM